VNFGAQKFLGREFLDSNGISENANMLCHVMQPNALLIGQNFITAKMGVTWIQGLESAVSAGPQR
jgi:hypothetical protein